MNREILFRAKELRHKKWCEGLLSVNTGGIYSIKGGFMTNGCDIDTGLPRLVPTYFSSQIDIETLGQFTGLLDKNGIKIFEGDVLGVDGYIGYVKWTIAGFQLIPANNVMHISFLYLSGKLHKYEIIGNIHDNPELLK